MTLTNLNELASNAALLLVLSFLYIQIIRQCEARLLTGQVLNGLLFGAVAVSVMLNPLTLLPGVVFDTRSVVISVGALFGGPVVAGITFAVASAFRVWMGGAGALMGVLVSFFSAALGLAYFYWRRADPRVMKAPYLYGFGLVVHLVMLACALALPGDLTWRVLEDIALPVIIVYPIATLLLCLLISDWEFRLESERLLKRSEERYRRIVDTANEGIWVIDADLKTTLVNARMAQLLGYAKDEMIGRPLRDFVFAEDMPGHREQMELRRQGQATQYELRMRRKDGGALWAFVSAAPIFDHGRFAGSLAMYTDISQRRREEEAQRADRVRRMMAMDLAKLVHWEYDVAADLFTFDEQFYALYGTSAAEQGGSSMPSQEYARRFIPPEEVHVVADAIAESMANTDPGYINHLEHRIIRADGQERFISVRFAVIMDEHGQTIKTYGVNQDITESKQAERSLREATERFRLAFETSPDSININRLSDGLYLEINQGFMDIMGYTREEVIGKTSLELDIWVDPADRAELASGLREKGVYANLEAKFRRKDGSIATGLMSACVIQINGQPHIISITRDIGQMRETERQRAELEERLRQAHKMEALGTLAGGIAHDFNNILSAITGYSELALDNAAEGAPVADELGQIISAADRAKELVRQILAFSRKGAFEPRPLNLSKVASQAVSILERTLPKMISIELSLAQDLPPVNGDPAHLEQVLLNLAGNAKDAMPDGGRLFIATRLVSLDRQFEQDHPGARLGEHVMLEVSDTGQGMDQHTREHIFEPFFTTKDVGKGTGLGLASVYGIVKTHGGSITCDSQPGRGSAFRVYLPVLSEFPEAGREPAAVAGPGLEGSETILLVDDEQALREIGSRILRRRGYQVLTGASGEEALEVYLREGGGVDLVVMDLGMPGMGGHKALVEILAADPGARVIIASGYSATVQVKAAREAGAAGYVAKPFRRDELLGEIRRVLDQ